MATSDSPYETGASRRWIAHSVEASLRRLDTDWIDLYQLHRPDPATPIDETLQALDDLVRAGKVRYAGYSNFAAWQLVDADWTARTGHLARPISAQDHYNLLTRDIERELLPACRTHGVGLVPYYPLESGIPGPPSGKADEYPIRAQVPRCTWPEFGGLRPKWLPGWLPGLLAPPCPGRGSGHLPTGRADCLAGHLVVGCPTRPLHGGQRVGQHSAE